MFLCRAWLLEELLCSAHCSASGGRQGISPDQAASLLQRTVDEMRDEGRSGEQTFFDDLLDRCDLGKPWSAVGHMSALQRW